MKKIYSILAFAVIVLFGISCSKSGNEVSVSGITLDVNSLDLYVGESYLLSATISPESATNMTVVWSSADESVAKVVGGMVTCVGVGSTTITVQTNDGAYSATCTINVKAAPTGISGVSLSDTTLTMNTGDLDTLIATIIPEDSGYKDVTWMSSNESVATVVDGVVTAVSRGTVRITVKTVVGHYTASCVVTVLQPVTSVSLDCESMVLALGESATLVAVVLPENANIQAVTWSSSDASIVSVSGQGVIKAVDVGTAIITVTTADGGLTATCEVTVPRIAATGVSLDKSSITLERKQTDTLTATVSPSDVYDSSVTWSSSDESVATVVDGVITAVGVGSATITATTNDGGYTATCAVTVTPIAVTGVSLNQTSMVLTIGDSSTLVATITPEDADDKTVSWTSSDTSIATVENGVVKAIALGTATITVTTNDGGYAAVCSVSVRSETAEDGSIPPLNDGGSVGGWK